jgi:hypothetical protein
MEVLAYAIRRGYHDIRDQAAPLSLDETFDLAKRSLSTEGLLAWVRDRVLPDRQLCDRSKMDPLSPTLFDRSDIVKNSSH